jgi:outer membrane protein insertion porin family
MTKTALILLLFVMAAVAPCPARASEPDVPTAGKVAGVRFDYPGELPSDIPGLVDISKGEPYSQRKVRDSIKLLYLKGMFKDIVVEGEDTPEGVELTYRLVPRLRITGIDIEGNDELSDKKILEKMALKEGDFLDDALVGKSRENVLKLYEEEGFRKASVTITPRQKDSVSARLQVEVREGPPTTVKEITFTGDLALPEKDLYKKLGIKTGKPIRKEDLDKSVNDLTDYYVNKDYVKAEVSPKVSYADDTASVEFHVAAGPRLTVDFEGNKSISKKVLKKALSFWEDRDLSEESVSENLDKLMEYYKGQGYYFAAVKSRTEESMSPASVSVKFIIDEGPRVKLSSIVLTGNKDIKTDDILDIMDLKASSFWKSRRITDRAVASDVERIKTYYETKGFLKAQVKAGDLEFNKDRTLATLKVAIDEGPRTFVTGIEIKGNGAVAADKILKVLKEKKGEPFNPQLIKDDTNDVLNLYSQKGYIDASMEVGQKLSEDGSGVQLVYNIKEGSPTYVGKIILRGNEHAKDIVVMRELLIKTGEPLDYEKLLRSQQRIYKLGFFSQARIQPVEREKKGGVKDLLVTVRERDAGWVEFGGGYGDFDRYRGFAEVGYRDLFGLGHRISLRGELSTKGVKALLSYKWPWFLGYSVDYRASLIDLDVQKPNYHIRDLIGLTGFDKSFGDRITSSFIYQYEKVKLGDVGVGAVLAPEDKKKSNIASISPSVVFDYRDNPFNPTTGSIHAATIKWASTYLGSTVDFIKLTAQTSWYYPLGAGIIAGVSARGGYENSLTSKLEIPISERFFLGGASSLRGYKLDSVSPKGTDGSPAGGDSSLLFNVEMRFPLPLGFGFVTFLDAGNVWLLNKNVAAGKAPNIGSNGLRYGTGVGLRYNTPVGPLRLDYGVKLSRLPGESPYEIHFTLGQAF